MIKFDGCVNIDARLRGPLWNKVVKCRGYLKYSFSSSHHFLLHNRCSPTKKKLARRPNNDLKAHSVDKQQAIPTRAPTKAKANKGSKGEDGGTCRYPEGYIHTTNYSTFFPERAVSFHHRGNYCVLAKPAAHACRACGSALSRWSQSSRCSSRVWSSSVATPRGLTHPGTNQLDMHLGLTLLRLLAEFSIMVGLHPLSTLLVDSGRLLLPCCMCVCAVQKQTVVHELVVRKEDTHRRWSMVDIQRNRLTVIQVTI